MALTRFEYLLIFWCRIQTYNIYFFKYSVYQLPQHYLEVFTGRDVQQWKGIFAALNFFCNFTFAFQPQFKTGCFSRLLCHTSRTHTTTSFGYFFFLIMNKKHNSFYFLYESDAAEFPKVFFHIYFMVIFQYV